MGKSKLKIPSSQTGARLSGGKSIAIPQNSGSRPADQSPPVFSLEHLRGDYCITACDVENKAAFAVALHRLSQLSWSKIRSLPRHGLGTEKIAFDAIDAPKPPHVTPDITLLAFRYNGMRPMVGYRDGAVFYVLWIDRNFTLYNHG